MAAKTWSGEWWKYGGGGTVWESMVADPDLNLLYIGVGNGSPWNRKIRSPGGGDNLFLTSIVALRIDTGEYVWHYQTVPGEEWDYTSCQPMMLADLRIGGRLRKVIMQAPKNGFFYVLDRATGQFISAKNHVPVNWAFGIDPKTGRPDVNPAARYPDGKLVRVQPASTGGHGWSPMAFDPHTGLVYFSSTINSMTYGNEPDTYRFEPGYINTGACSTCRGALPNPALPVAEPATYLLAWDPVRQAPAWKVKRAAVRDGGVLATGGDVVFQGSGDGVFYAHDAATGEELWSFPVQSAALTGPISYSVKGEQYIALPVGAGYSSQLKGAVPYPALLPNTNRILAFKLEAHGTLPAVAYAPQPLPEPPPLTSASTDTIARGHAIYNRYCFVCHGFDATGEGVHPDLRFSNVLGSATNWAQVVVDGVRKDNGMIGFAPAVDRDTAEAIRAFVITQAHAARSLSPAALRNPLPIQ
jgi:mono/diheme cytochrome c family protein